MKTIQFNAVVDQEQIIRPPSGVTLPQGEIEVTVRLPRQVSQFPANDPLASTRAWLLDLADEAQRAAPALPGDLAEHHDYYAHGKPRS